MRCFVGACLFGVIVACLGCMTHNWSSRLFPEHTVEKPRDTDPRSPLFSSRGVGDYLFGEPINGDRDN